MNTNRVLFFFLLLFFVKFTEVQAQQPWEILPPTPSLPTPTQSGYASINGIQIWYATFGQGEPIIMLHGGFANSQYWGYQVPELAKHYQVIVMDSRGQGRSTNDGTPYSYHLMAKDVIALMNYLHIHQATMVGWSDGADIALDIALHHPKRVSKIFAFGAISSPSGTKNVNSEDIPILVTFFIRAFLEYVQLSSTPTQFCDMARGILQMWATQPHFTAKKLHRITVPTWIVYGEHDEVNKRKDAKFLARNIPNACLLIQPDVSHFSFLQNPRQFNADLQRFLDNPDQCMPASSNSY